jgi:hypothetical protein
MADASQAAARLTIEHRIIVSRALVGNRGQLVLQFGASLIDHLIRRADEDMRAAMQADTPVSKEGLKAGLRNAQAILEHERKLRSEADTANTGHGFSSQRNRGTVSDYQELIDDYDLPTHNGEPAPLPLTWFLPVRRALELEAELAHEGAALAAADLLGRVEPSPHVQEITESLAASATEAALVQ